MAQKRRVSLWAPAFYYVQLFDKKVINIDFLIHKLGADKKILRLFQGLNGFRRNFHAEIIETVHGVNGFSSSPVALTAAAKLL